MASGRCGRGPRIAFVLLVMGVGVWFLLRQPNRRAQQTHATTSTPAAQASDTPANAAGATVPNLGPQDVVERLPVPDCWENLLGFDQSVKLEEMQAALARAAQSGDNLLVKYLQERLAELVGQNAQAALQVIGWAEKASPPLLNLYLEALKDTEAIQAPQVAARLVGLSSSSKASLEVRRAALDALETQRHLDAAGIGQIKAVALDEHIGDVAWVATRTLGRVMKEDFERGGTFKPYWKELLDISQHSAETAVRTLALEMPSYAETILDSAAIDPLSKILRQDPDRHVREMAAFRLGVTESPDKALEAYRGAFPEEKDQCVRWAIFRFAVRAAGAGALPLLQQFATIDPRFKADYEDFQKLYASGTVDFSRIWLGKQERIQCLDEGE